MCGLAAIFGPDKKESSNIKDMIKSISHRGPDHEGFHFEEKIMMGSCRLSIFDLSSKGNMPMKDKTGRYLIIYNGEIYNFKELKNKYEIKTISNSDTEVLLELFAKIGDKTFNEINGIYAFILFDKTDNKVYCVRDRLGVKPLYYFKKKNNYFFSSEIKGILKIFENININEKIVKFYLDSSYYDFSESTFFENIYQVNQGTYHVYNLQNNTSKKIKYWDLEPNKIYNKEYSQIKKYFFDSFKLQQRSDTKIGLNVSSGIDSNLMISFLNLINKGQKNIFANSYYFKDKEFNHSDEISDMSKYYNWKINLCEITHNDVIENFDKISNFQDEPMPGLVTIAKHLLIQKSYDNDCKVVLEGQGGDDIAGGYKYVFPLFILDSIKKLSLNKTRQEIKGFLDEENMNFKEFIKFFFVSIRSYFKGGASADGTISRNKDLFFFDKTSNNDLYKQLLKNLSNKKTFFKKILYRDLFFCKLPRILRSCDRASMAHGKELRVPILDHNIVEYFYYQKNGQFIKNGKLRYNYREVYYKLFDEQNLFKDNKFIQRKKIYVTDPQTKWLKTKLFDWMYSKLMESNFNYSGLIDKKKLQQYLLNFKKDENINNSNILWQLLNLEKLYSKR